MRTARTKQDLSSFIQAGTPRVGLTKADAAYAEIKQGILTCSLAPGSAIDQEMVAAWLGSSTTPVREALRRLAAEQLVVMRAHSEARVAPASVDEFREFHLIRIGLEPLAAEIATKMVTDEELDSLRELVHPKSAHDAADQSNLDGSRLFHQRIYAASRNRTATQILDSIWDRAGRYRVMLAGVGSVSSCESPEHQAIFAALEARDRGLIGDLVRQDLDSSYRRVLPELEDMLGDAQD